MLVLESGVGLTLKVGGNYITSIRHPDAGNTGADQQRRCCAVRARHQDAGPKAPEEPINTDPGAKSAIPARSRGRADVFPEAGALSGGAIRCAFLRYLTELTSPARVAETKIKDGNASQRLLRRAPSHTRSWMSLIPDLRQISYSLKRRLCSTSGRSKTTSPSRALRRGNRARRRSPSGARAGLGKHWRVRGFRSGDADLALQALADGVRSAARLCCFAITIRGAGRICPRAMPRRSETVRSVKTFSGRKAGTPCGLSRMRGSW
jgi:hypothetical protein